MIFQEKLEAAIKKNNSLVCVGLDPVLEKLPKHVQETPHAFFSFNKAIIDATHNIVCCYKPNSAFYEALGEKGIGELKKTCDYIKENYPEIPIILDAKRGDIGSTNEGYVSYAFDYLSADAITLHPYLGKEALLPFLNRKDKTSIILCHTTNAGAEEIQDITVIPAKAGIQKNRTWIPDQVGDDKGEPLYKVLAKKIVNEWNENKNCMLVLGAKYPEQLAEVRKVAGDMTFLIPGIGAQGGDIKQVIAAGRNSIGEGMIINSSRDIIFAGNGEDFAEKAREKAEKLRDEINTYRNL